MPVEDTEFLTDRLLLWSPDWQFGGGQPQTEGRRDICCGNWNHWHRRGHSRSERRHVHRLPVLLRSWDERILGRYWSGRPSEPCQHFANIVSG
jgi:hypothetical protein